MTPLQAAKRAARQNPTLKQANVYVVATDEGETVYSAEGEMQFDLAEETWGFVDRAKETTFTINETYQGDTVITVLSEVSPNGAAMILIGGVFYGISTVHSADAAQVTMRYVCNALSETDAPTIRSNSL